MFSLPQSTEFNRRIPKQKFYENMPVSAELKRVFVEQVNAVIWRSKISPQTTNLAAGSYVTEIEIIEIRLAAAALDTALLQQIDKTIPYHIVFLLEYEGKYQAWTAYKEAASGANAFKIQRYYHTEWMAEAELPLKLEGLDTDMAYENFVRQIGGDALAAANDETLRQAVERDARRQQLQKQIAALQAKVRKEKQLNKQVELNAEVKRLKTVLEEL